MHNEQSPASDLQQIKALALAWTKNSWYGGFQVADGIINEEAIRFIVSASPAVVLGLIARIERLQKGYGITHQALCEISQPADEGRSHKVDADDMRETAIDALSEAESVIDFGETVSERAAVSAATKPTGDLMSRLYARHKEWAERSGHAPMGWEEFKADRMDNPLSAAAIERSKNPAYGVARTISDSPVSQALDILRELAIWAEDKAAGDRAWDALQCAEAVRALRNKAAGAEGAK